MLKIGTTVGCTDVLFVLVEWGTLGYLREFFFFWNEIA